MGAFEFQINLSRPLADPFFQVVEIRNESVEDDLTHDSAANIMRSEGSVVITRPFGGGYASKDGLLQFRNVTTFVADVRLSGGKFYWEIEIIDMRKRQTQFFQHEQGDFKFGIVTEGFAPNETPGIGHTAHSWSVDGGRQVKWHNAATEAYGCAWDVGDVIGLALDMSDSSSSIVSLSVNGSFAAPNGIAFAAIDAAYLSPAFSGHGRYRLNLGDRPFAFAPPDEGYGSVSLYLLRRLAAHAATAFPNLRVICTAQQGDGMEIKGQLVRRNRETMYDMVISNHTQQSLSGIAVQFNENIFSLMPGVMPEITGASHTCPSTISCFFRHISYCQSNLVNLCPFLSP